MTPTFAGRVPRSILTLTAAALLASLPQASHAQAWGAQSQSTLARAIGERAGDLRPFYATRGFAPLWVDSAGQLGPAAESFLLLLDSARNDGVDPARIAPPGFEGLLARAQWGDKRAAAQADVALSRAFAAYVRAVRGADIAPMLYESAALAPMVPTVRAVLESAAASGSLDDYVARIGWMHPFYAPLRAALDDPGYSETQRRLIETNLARVRALPPLPQGKYILVDAASAQLWMFEDGEAVDAMKVVVGKPDLQTPMMAGFIRTAIRNPYWNVPDDLVQTNIAANVLQRGLGYLAAEGYQVFADWDNVKLLDPKTIDWRAVRDGRNPVHVRQLPGGSNFMGKVKFEFPNAQGIYLHDTPDKGLLDRSERQLSSGCVRLEDAARMHRWLMDEPLPMAGAQAEQAAPLPQPVPIYITYLTALPRPGGSIAFHADPYTRDGIQLAGTTLERGQTDRP